MKSWRGKLTDLPKNSQLEKKVREFIASVDLLDFDRLEIFGLDQNNGDILTEIIDTLSYYKKEFEKLLPEEKKQNFFVGDTPDSALQENVKTYFDSFEKAKNHAQDIGYKFIFECLPKEIKIHKID